MNTILYCYDAYCGWCYAFSPVITKLSVELKNEFHFEVLSGGMIINEKPIPIAVSAPYIQGAYKKVEEYTGIRFGQDYLWHIFHPEQSDWFPDSEKPAIAMCIFKEWLPGSQVAFAADLQYALHFEGRDLCDDEAYRHLLDKYQIPAQSFYQHLHSEKYKSFAKDEFQICKKLGITGFPTVLFQESEKKFYLLSRGFTDYATLKDRFSALTKNRDQAANS
jgi:putative protein-disulfide isomerase